MPVTPFHFGPGLAFKGVAAPVFSWSAFAAVQVVIDCETFYYLINHEYPVHRFLHSFLGAGVVGFVAAILFFLLVRVSAVAFPGLIAPRTATNTARGEVSPLGVLLGSLAGGLSHPLLDGIMHPDVRPFMPWSDHNPFLGLIGVVPLHLACIAAAPLGAVCVTLWRRRSDRRAT